MTTADLSFGKIASTPTKTAWSQAYSAGGLFVILSLSLTDPEKEHESLAITGKNFLNDLEAEFFPLEEKNTDGIGKALEKVATEVPSDVILTTVVAFHKDGTLYLFLIGNGSIIIKRKESLGTILSQADTQGRGIKSASGYLSPQDTLLLASETFKNTVDNENIKTALSSSDIDEAIEILTPYAQTGEDGSVCALVFRQKENAEEHLGLAAEPDISTKQDQQTTEDNYLEEDPPVPTAPIETPSQAQTFPTEQTLDEAIQNAPPGRKLPSFKLPFSFSSLSHRRKVILSVAAILLVVLSLSVFFTVNTQAAKERTELFNSIYPEALENYEKAEGLLSLNKPLAREELLKAQDLLVKTEGKFPQSSEEYKKTTELSVKIEDLLGEVGEAKTVEATEISDDESQILASLKANDAIAAVEDETSVYYLTDNDINSIRKGSKSEQTLVENDDDWADPVGLGKFGSNFYVLDTEKGVLKLVPSGTEYNVSNYLVDDVSVADSVSMTLDTSVYILYKNGEIKKFTRGEEEDFTVSDLENKLSSPTQITTNEKSDNLYILDPATARIVKLKKDGGFVEEYQTQVLQDAKAIAIANDESKAYILSGGKLYEISL